jgi:DNA repair exonuclease SbcCD nuclease subunit
VAFRLLHLADLHLDSSFSNSSFNRDLSNLRRAGLRDILKRAFSLAREKNVDAVTIGGDLFESERVSADTAHFLRDQFAELAPIRVFITPGNHDPFTLQSPYNFIHWSSNVHIFREPRLTGVLLTDDLDLWGAAHDSPAFFQPLVSDFQLPSAKPALLLLHGTESRLNLGKDEHIFCPFSAQEIRRSGFSLALLGHIHQPSIFPDTPPLLCYPGSPEPLGFDEEHEHTVLLADWDGKQWTVTPHAINAWVCKTAELDVSAYASREQIVERVRGMFLQERAEKKVLLRVRLRGTLQPTMDLDMTALRAGVGDTFADVSWQDETAPFFDYTALQKEPTARGIFVKQLTRAMENATRDENWELQERLERALHLGLLALEGKEIPAP